MLELHNGPKISPMYLFNEAYVNLPNSRTSHRIARRVERAGLARSCLILELQKKMIGYRVCGENMYSDRNNKQTFDNYIMTFCSNDGPTATGAPQCDEQPWMFPRQEVQAAHASGWCTMRCEPSHWSPAATSPTTPALGVGLEIIRGTRRRASTSGISSGRAGGGACDALGLERGVIWPSATLETRQRMMG